MRTTTTAIRSWTKTSSTSLWSPNARMPEGDSIRRLASQLEPVLVGRTVTAFQARRISDDTARAIVGRPVIAVDAHGKNLLVRFDGDLVLHVHLRMKGRIAIERPRSAFWAPRGSYSPDLRLAVTGGAIVGHDLPVCRLLSSSAERRDAARLGPDLIRDGFDEDEALRRLRALGPRELGDALMLQSVVAGIGNVYKSEVLFLEKLDPRTPVPRIDDERLRLVLRRASALLRANLGSGPRTTRRALSGPRLWVYRRDGRACLRCGAAIVRYHQGAPPGRSTYACPMCQGAER
jgi:endonuclease-8